MNYHWEAESYVTPWNMDKHVNDEGGCDGPGYFCLPLENFTDKRPAWEMFDLFLTLDSKDNWYIQYASITTKVKLYHGISVLRLVFQEGILSSIPKSNKIWVLLVNSRFM